MILKNGIISSQVGIQQRKCSIEEISENMDKGTIQFSEDLGVLGGGYIKKNWRTDEAPLKPVH